MGGPIARQIVGQNHKQGYKSNLPYTTATKKVRQHHNLPNGRRQIMQATMRSQAMGGNRGSVGQSLVLNGGFMANHKKM